MQKAIKIFFLICYLLGTMGFTVVTHYCGGKIDSVSIFRTINDTDPCGCEGNTCCNPCCNDEVKNFKIEDFHNIATKSYQSLDITSNVHTPLIENNFACFENFNYLSTNFSLPPPDKPLFIRNHSFLI